MYSLKEWINKKQKEFKATNIITILDHDASFELILINSFECAFAFDYVVNQNYINRNDLLINFDNIYRLYATASYAFGAEDKMMSKDQFVKFYLLYLKYINENFKEIKKEDSVYQLENNLVIFKDTNTFFNGLDKKLRKYSDEQVKLFNQNNNKEFEKLLDSFDCAIYALDELKAIYDNDPKSASSETFYNKLDQIENEIRKNIIEYFNKFTKDVKKARNQQNQYKQEFHILVVATIYILQLFSSYIVEINKNINQYTLNNEKGLNNLKTKKTTSNQQTKSIKHLN